MRCPWACSHVKRVQNAYFSVSVVLVISFHQPSFNEYIQVSQRNQTPYPLKLPLDACLPSIQNIARPYDEGTEATLQGLDKTSGRHKGSVLNKNWSICTYASTGETWEVCPCAWMYGSNDNASFRKYRRDWIRELKQACKTIRFLKQHLLT